MSLLSYGFVLPAGADPTDTLIDHVATALGRVKTDDYGPEDRGIVMHELAEAAVDAVSTAIREGVCDASDL